MNLTKAQSLSVAADLPGCWQALAYSHTCYRGAYPPCGDCPACKIRAKGFHEAEKLDPALERARSEGLIDY